MRYGIITHYDVHNHGAILQLNALASVLQKEFGIEAKALQFDKNYDFMGHELKVKYEISVKSIGIYMGYLKKNGLRRMLFNVKKKSLLDGFKKSHGLIGPYYTTCGQLDGVIVGSDEVFALHTGPTPVFFGHACPSDKVFAYGGCFGPTTLADVEQRHCRPLVASGLAAMKGLGMRDRNSIDIARALTGKEPVSVCDPVILYGYAAEMAAQEAPQLPPYLLVYAYDNKMNDPKEVVHIRDFAKKRNLKIVSPGFYHKWVDYNINADPVEVLRYFKHAACVVTDTFHGSVMSLISGRDMAVKLRDNANKLLNLLEEYGLQERVLTEEWNLDEVLDKPIDYEKVNAELSRRRSESIAYIKRMVEL